MQILPTVSPAQTENSQSQIQALMAQSLQQYATSFASSLETAQAGLTDHSVQAELPDTSVQAELAETKENEEEKQEKKVAADVYSTHSSNGLYNLDEICFSQKECAELYNGLLGSGAPVKNLDKLRKLTELPDGCTLGQVLQSLKSKDNDLSLSDEDANEITSLLNGLDPSGQLASRTLDELYNGKTLDALRGITSALEEMGALDSIEVSRQEMLALGRGLGLNDQAMHKIQELFSDQENATFSPHEMKKALAPAEDQLLQEKSDQQKLDNALAKNLGPILNKARERMEQEAAAQNLRNRDADHSQTMIDRTVLKDSRQILNTTLEAMHNQNAPAEHSTLGKERVLAANFADLGQQGTGNEMQGKQDGWNDLLDKMSMPLNFKGMTQINAGSVRSNALSGNVQQAISQHLVSQVENGLFSTLRNGATRLELQLHPQELGALTISLVAHNGEVSAHIRADNAETVTMLSQQAELIKSHLEEQGVKVDSIEVELREQDAQAEHEQQLLQDMEHHNSFQEEDARREQLRRLRNLANLENLKAGSASGELERSVHSHRETETSASRLLDRVA
ncbi:MAG: flagellar hook-length control protein FliK [Desulfovibrio sp.]|nr:flagellar hook-length control protein FliK [Desulfovibrio sp.]